MMRNKKFTKILLFAFLFLCLILINGKAFSNSNSNTTLNNINYYVVNEEVKQEETINELDSVKQQLIDNVRNYIITRHKNCPDEIPEHIVRVGLNYNIDICFIMAQTQIETCFGKGGIGKTKKSLFGVMKRSYKTYGDAIEDYAKILKKSYLVNGKTEHDLMKRYVSSSGYKYAGNPRYEVELKNTYNIICKSTNIRELQKSLIVED